MSQIGQALVSPPAASQSPVPVIIETEERTYQFECPQDGVILYEALRAGIPLAYSCATGICGTCAARVLDGSVKDLWRGAPGISPESRDKGRVLTCQSAASAPVRLRGSGSLLRGRPLLPAPEYRAARLTDVNWAAPGVAELWLQLDSSLPFIPGQFILIWFSGLDGPRALSVANTERPPVKRVRLFVKPRNGSVLESLLRAGVVVGASTRVFGPIGNACLDGDAAQGSITCVAGSTGIAPMLPILADWVDRSAGLSGQLVYGVRTGRDAVALNDILDIAKRSHGRLTVVIALSESGNGEVQALQRQVDGCGSVVCAFAHEAIREMLNGRRPGGVAFVSGPKPMVQASVKTLVLHGGFSGAAIRSDDFG